jgi:hypothetical protein
MLLLTFVAMPFVNIYDNLLLGDWLGMSLVNLGSQSIFIRIVPIGLLWRGSESG